MWPARASRETAGAWVVAPWTKHAFAAVWASHTHPLTMAGAKKIVARHAQ